MRVEFPNERVDGKDDSLIILARNITTLRESMELTSERLAEYIGSSASHISKLERAKTLSPSYFVIRDLARLFGVSAEQLMTEDVSKFSDRNRALKRMADNFSSDEWDVVVAQVDGITRRQASKGEFRHRVTKAQ